MNTFQFLLVKCEKHETFCLYLYTDMIQISKISLEIWMNMAMNMAIVLQCLHTVSNMCLKNADTAFRFGCKIVLSSLTPSVVPEQETPHSCLDCHTRPQISCQAVCASLMQVPRSRSAGRKCQSSTETVTTADRSRVKLVQSRVLHSTADYTLHDDSHC